MSASVTDETRAVRAGEEVDVAKLEAFIRANLPDYPGAVSVSQFPGGHSNLTYLVKVGERELVLRRPPFGNRVKTAHDMGREYKILSRLHPAYSPAPRALAYTEDTEILGCPFYLMERLRGVVLRSKSFPKEMDWPVARIRELGESFADAFAALHSVDYEAAGLGDLGKPDGYVERQVRGWIKRYGDAKTDDVPDMETAARWLEEQITAGLPLSKPSLIHNDFKFDNLVLDPQNPTRIIGVLDWEMATLGEPLMDLGTALAYWVTKDDPEEMKQMPFGPTMAEGMLTRTELAERWSKVSKRELQRMDFFVAFAHYKNAVVGQQIYWRFKNGHTKDERFAKFLPAVFALSKAALRATKTPL